MKKLMLAAGLALVMSHATFAAEDAGTVSATAEFEAIQSAFVQDVDALNIKELAATEMRAAKAGPRCVCTESAHAPRSRFSPVARHMSSSARPT